jgi:hypothetical protein
MKIMAVVVAIVCGACGGSPKQTPPGPPQPGAPEQGPLVGDFTHAFPEGPVVLRFSTDGTCAVAGTVEGLATPGHRCTWTLEGKRLVFTNTEGNCATAEPTRIGSYDIEVTEASVSFKKIADTCANRMAIDGQTWDRIKAP